MDASTLTERLIANMQWARKALDALLATMQANRSAWIAIRPSELERSVATMDAQAAAVRDLDRERAAVLDELGTALGIPAPLTVSALCRVLPATTARRLRADADALDRAARAVKVETRFGERLLASSRRIQDGLFQQAVRDAEGEQPRSYDRSAHAAAERPRAGSLVNGLV